MRSSSKRTKKGREGEFATGAVPLRLQVNGVTYNVQLEPRVSLLDALREYLGLTGTKKGCNQGACGACTVLVDGARINACFALAVQYQDREITTDEVAFRDGGIYRTDDATQGETFAALLTRLGMDKIEAAGAAGPGAARQQFALGSYGAQFCEVRVDEDTGEVRVGRFLGVFDCGRILNPKTASSQFRGGITMGIGMALTEEALFDVRLRRIVNPSLAEYHVPVNLDVPDIAVH
jgi:CO/xanthine dehydrogenase Mo-binding subunit